MCFIVSSFDDSCCHDSGNLLLFDRHRNSSDTHKLGYIQSIRPLCIQLPWESCREMRCFRCSSQYQWSGQCRRKSGQHLSGHAACLSYYYHIKQHSDIHYRFHWALRIGILWARDGLICGVLPCLEYSRNSGACKRARNGRYCNNHIFRPGKLCFTCCMRRHLWNEFLPNPSERMHMLQFVG